jgi:hypothetical protein
LKYHAAARMTLHDSMVDWDPSGFPKHDWTLFYREATESIPPKPNMPEPCGHSVQLNCFVDADHASNQLTRCSHTGILLYVNHSPIIWYSKHQNTVESSTFGSEFITTKIAVDQVEALQIKLCMFGVPLDGPANMLVDNHSIVLNSTNPTSSLKKKHNAIAYHRVREAIASNTICVAKAAGKKNLADLFTKILPSIDLVHLSWKILYFPDTFPCQYE